MYYSHKGRIVRMAVAKIAARRKKM